MGDAVTPEQVLAWKKAERERLIAERMALPLDQHAAKSAAISAALAEHFPAGSLTSLGCYWPFRREYDCLPLMRRIVEQGGQVALPVVIARNQPLEFRPWTPQTKMEAGVWNILHPAEGPAVQPKALLVPLVGFDAAGYRVGYGAGYYDRTLATFPTLPVTIGVGFELCRLPTIHPQPHDLPMDYIITEAGLVHTAAARV